jgi:anti-sigma factor RsiW
MRCPDPVQLEAFVDGELPAERLAEVARHLEGCPTCAGRVRQTQRLVTLLRRHQEAVSGSLDAGLLLAAARRQADHHRTVRAAWRRSLVAAGLVLALGAGATAYQIGLVPTPAGFSDPFSQALLREHQRFESALAADRELNVQVATLEQ